MLAISVPTSLGVNTMDDLVKLARAEPGKLNVAAATGNSDFLIFGFMKDMNLDVTRVPYRDIMLAPNDLSQSRIQVLSSFARRGAIDAADRTRQGAARDQPQARGNGARHSDRGRGRLSATDHGNRGRALWAEGACRRRSAKRSPPISATSPSTIRSSGQRLIDTGQIMNMLRPAEFGANIKEQNDQLAAIAKTLGLKTPGQ